MKNDSSEKVAKGGRVVSIDVLRGFAIVCMVLIHFTHYYGNEAAADTFLAFSLDYGLASWGAATFSMMMGMSQVFSAKKNKNLDNMLLFKRALIRSVYIFLIGLLIAKPKTHDL